MKVVCNMLENLGKIVIALAKRLLGLSVSLLPAFIATIMWSILCGLPLMFCWNRTMPYILLLPSISYFRAVCLAFMLSLFLAKNTVACRKK